MLSVGSFLLLLGAAIGTRWRIAALGCAVAIASVGAFLATMLNGAPLLTSAGWAAYAAVMLQAGYLTASLIAARFVHTRKPAAAPACSQS